MPSRDGKLRHFFLLNFSIVIASTLLSLELAAEAKSFSLFLHIIFAGYFSFLPFFISIYLLLIKFLPKSLLIFTLSGIITSVVAAFILAEMITSPGEDANVTALLGQALVQGIIISVIHFYLLKSNIFQKKEKR